LQCTCGSAVLFDKPKPPWAEHDCSSGGIGGIGLSGWAAVDVLRANGVPIDANIMAKVFPPKLRSGKAGASPPPESMAAMEPEAGKKIDLVAIVRGLLTDTKKTDRLKALGDLGTKLLRLPKGDLWQLTLVINSERPNLTYTCIPASGAWAPERREKQDGVRPDRSKGRWRICDLASDRNTIGLSLTRRGTLASLPKSKVRLL
jgi:hypothetical protein